MKPFAAAYTPCLHSRFLRCRRGFNLWCGCFLERRLPLLRHYCFDTSTFTFLTIVAASALTCSV
nr:MAG TPA: hypothetical protein [Caudoviricetes sp.]